MSKKKSDKVKSMEMAAQSGAANEVIDRYGKASKEHLVGYSGIDHESGTQLKRGLKSISQSKVNPDYTKQNLKQQAGYSAEVKYTARQNAEKIINKENTRYTRTDDVGKVNDPLYDHVLLNSEGIEIAGSGEQMKFVGSNPKESLKKLTSKPFQKYLDADTTITVPSDYYEGIISEANKEILSLEQQLARAKLNNNQQQIATIEQRLKQLRKVKANIKDSGITNKEALFARRHPKLSTAKDIGKISQRAGVEQAKWGAAISGGLSFVQNVVAVAKGEKSAKKAALSVAKDAGKGAVTAYTTAFAGSAIKAGMQNSASSLLRGLSKTNAPATIVTSAKDVMTSMTKYLKGEISGEDCLIEIVEKGTSHLGAAMFAAIGQAAIPIPVVGAMVGSMVGYALTSAVYSTLTKALKDAQIAHEERLRLEKECAEAISLIRQYRAEMNNHVQNYLQYYTLLFDDAFAQMDAAFLGDDINKFIQGANKITTTLGETIQFSDMKEFDHFMNTSNSFNL